MANRLNLDFALQTQEERTKFTEQYLKQIKFTPNERELDIIAKYILWGKDANGKNSKQTGDIELETAHKTWDTKSLESLDGLYESETFTEASVKPLSYVRPLIRKPVFSRDSVPATPAFENLWDQIDETEFTIQTYEILHAKREKEIRAELQNRLTDDQKAYCKLRAAALSEKDYLKLRHHLVELRTEQYTLRDSFVTLHQIHSPAPYTKPELSYFGADIPVLPIGLLNVKKTLCLPNGREVASATPLSFVAPDPGRLFFDFSNPDHLYAFTSLYDDIYDMSTEDAESTFNLFIDTFNFYRQFAELTPIQEDVLQAKIERQSNVHIMNVINQKYSTTYNSNYISTIYKQKALVKIAQAARLYGDIVKNLDKPNMFKTCTHCGRTLLLCEDNFMHKAKSKDGFESRCKRCSKQIRNQNKEV